MTITINGKSYPTFIIDTIQTILARYATELETIPDFLSVEKQSNIVYDIVDELHSKYYAKNDIDIPDNYSTRGLKIFVATNTYLRDNESQRRFLIAHMQQKLPAGAFDVERAWASRKEIIDKLDADIRSNKLSSIRFSAVAKKFDYFVSTTPYVEEMTIKSITYNFNIRLDDDDADDALLTKIFDRIDTSAKIPFVYLNTWDDNEFYKLHVGFHPRADWIDLKGRDILYLKIFDDYNDYVNCGIKRSDGSSNNVTLTLNVHLRKNFDVEKFIASTLRDIFNTSRYAILERKDIGVVADVAFPNQSLDVDVMSDVIMNDVMVSRILAVDEFIKASKVKRNIYAHSLLRQDETLNYLEKLTEKHNQFPTFPSRVKQPYVRCQIKTSSFERLDIMRTVSAKILTIVSTNKSDIVTFYRQYVPNFDASTTTTKRSAAAPTKRKFAAGAETRLRDIAPEIFVSQYPRKCANKPTIVDESWAGELQVMEFPSKGESVTRRYICDQKSNYKYPGLMVNPLANKDQFPFVPCCYSKDQALKENSPYRRYFFDEGPAVAPTQQLRAKYTYSTNKILPKNIMGNLPDVLHRLFVACDIDPYFTYKRLGVDRTPFSAVQVVLRAIGSTVEDVKRLVDDEILSSEAMMNATKQETYDDSDNHYFSIRKYVHALEELFDCDIFIFDSAHIVVPKHSEMYCKYKPSSRRVIFIYEHWGSESDSAEYPQCELVVKCSASKDDAIESLTFAPDSVIARRVNGIFGISNQCVAIDAADQTPFPILHRHAFADRISAQCIDIYGKCRGVLLDDDVFVIFNVPYPPFAAPIFNRRVDAVSFDHLMKNFVEPYRLKIDGKIVTKNAIYVALNDASYFVKVDVEPEYLVELLAKKYLPALLSYDIDKRLHRFNDARKYVNLYKQIALNLYAVKHYNDVDDALRDATIVSNQRIELMTKIITFNPTYDFIRTRYFENDYGSFKVQSQQFLDRLAFALRMIIKYHPTRLHFTDTKIKNLFVYPTDFINRNASNVILKPNFMPTYANMDDSNIVHDDIQRDKQKYLYQNDFIFDGAIFVAVDYGEDIYSCVDAVGIDAPIFSCVAGGEIVELEKSSASPKNSMLTYLNDDDDQLKYVALMIS